MRMLALERLFRTVLVSLLVLVYMAVLALLLLPGGSGFRLPAAAGLLTTASGAALATWWLIAGPGRWFVRGPIAIVCLGVLFVAAGFVAEQLLAPLLAVQVLVIGGVLWGRRLRGLHFRYDADIEPARRHGQYSVRSLLALTGAVAVAIVAAKAIRAQLDLEYSVPVAFAVVSTGLGLAAVSLAAIWTALAPGAPWRRLAITAAVAPICGAAPAYACARESDVVLLAATLSVYAAVVCGSFFVLRLCGYRLVSRRRSVSSRRIAPAAATRRLPAKFAGETS